MLLLLLQPRSTGAANCTADAPAPSTCICVPCNPMPKQGHCKCTETCVGSRPCGPGFEHCGPAPAGGPVYHLHTRSGCGENDPNGVMYDAKHDMYHVFFQDHLSQPGGSGPVWGHWASRDFVRWTTLPVAIWNDQWYDSNAIFSGSATFDEAGDPIITYPGLCPPPPGSPGHPKKPGVPPNPLAHVGCETGTTYAQAIPADRDGDPFLTNWTKPHYNPIVNRTSDDPSSAWKTGSGEWRFLGNGLGRGECPIFAAPKLSGPWTAVGSVANFSGGECPSLFPLPRLTPGTSVGPGEQLPSHVFKRGKCPDPQCRLTDKFILGNFTDGRSLTDPMNATPGTFVATPGVPFPCKQEVDNGQTGKDRKVLVANPCSGDGTDGKVAGDNLVDYGGFYASKDFWDAKHQRRVLWGWSMYSGKSLPRELTYDPRFQTIVQSPVHELRQLRSVAPVASTGGAKTPLKPGQELPLYKKAAGNASDAMVTFQLPTSLTLTGMFGVSTMGIVPADGTDGHLSACSTGVFVGLNFTAPTAAQRAAGKYNVTTTVNGKDGQLWLLTNETEVTVEVFTDISVVEVYWQGGRSVTTGSAAINEPHKHTPLPLPPGTVRGGMAICNNASASIDAHASVWTMGSIWATKAEVEATPRHASQY